MDPTKIHLQVLQDTFRFPNFREGQEEVITRILAGKSVLSIFPTGSGKSLCYQLPALLLPGLTVVVSPLIALIDDQLAFLHSRNISAVKIDSTLTPPQAQQIKQELVDQKHKILFVSVERFKNERFRRFLHSLTLSMLVVDEAHCISEWGHNFRPDYIKLPEYKKEFGFPQVLLLTATAPKVVQKDIIKKFNISSEDVISTGFYRDNLNINIQGTSIEDKIEHIDQLISIDPKAPTIIYVTLQDSAVKVATKLVEKGYCARPYHAGLSNDLRRETQELFMKGQVDIIVATIAFGMGIDKSDIRRVIHYDLPKSLEGLSQEIGRAGRDGHKSECTILGNLDHIQTLENFVYGDTPDPKSLEDLVNDILEKEPTWEANIYQTSIRYNIRQLPLKTALVYLEALGVLSPTHSYYSEYRFKSRISPQEVASHFSGERMKFVKDIFTYSDKARIWYNVDFDKIAKGSPQATRERVVNALDYFVEKQWIDLETKKMMEVYRVTPPQNHSKLELIEHLYQLFKNKEKGEIFRINQVIDLICSNSCFYHQLTQYFGQETSWEKCGHCSNCKGTTITIPDRVTDEEFESFSYKDMKELFLTNYKASFSAHDFGCYLCGISAPLLSRYRVKKLRDWARFTDYRFQSVMDWIETNEKE
ncbi:RecQ family ATP-dependent DNA helicase [Halosquirtibacter xylanolyticus]|uniref:RecQ family ATP-dependent DNA helicase n=1 Tax=Halosquirtibacter xylanolyticus TaxID=3374599 RepID=UPI00374A1856|nr:RecQ family ATP-dependent DNA helicase [Prolixibacteraceae bacterium]